MVRPQACTCLSGQLPVPWVHLSVSPSVCFSICLSVCLSVCPSICNGALVGAFLRPRFRCEGRSRGLLLQAWPCVQEASGLDPAWQLSARVCHRHGAQPCWAQRPLGGSEGRLNPCVCLSAGGRRGRLRAHRVAAGSSQRGGRGREAQAVRTGLSFSHLSVCLSACLSSAGRFSHSIAPSAWERCGRCPRHWLDLPLASPTSPSHRHVLSIGAPFCRSHRSLAQPMRVGRVGCNWLARHLECSKTLSAKRRAATIPLCRLAVSDMLFLQRAGGCARCDRRGRGWLELHARRPALSRGNAFARAAGLTGQPGRLG
jgi:hypothetical protein